MEVKQTIAQVAPFNHLFGQSYGWDAPVVVTNHVHHARFLDRAHHGLGFSQIAGQRLLAQDCFAGPRRRHGDLAMRIVRRANIDDVDFGIVHNAAPIGFDFLPAQFRGRFPGRGPVAATQRFQPQLHGQGKEMRGLSPRIRMGLAHKPVTYQGDRKGTSGAHMRDSDAVRYIRSEKCYTQVKAVLLRAPSP